jgi:hypothetical protein
MTPSFIRTAALAALVLVAGASQARAEAFVVRVPFDFTVNGHQLPAGNYSIEREVGSSVVLLRNERDTKSTLYAQTMQGNEVLRPPAEPYLTFGQYENSYRLESLWSDASGERDLLRTHDGRHRTATIRIVAQPAS